MLKKISIIVNKKRVIALTLLLIFLICAYITVAYIDSKAAFSTEDRLSNIIKNMEIYLGGEAAGIKLLATGVLVVDNEQDNNIKMGDIILEVDGAKIESNSELIDLVQKSEGKEITLKIERNGKPVNEKITPIYLEEEKIYELGLWVKDSSAGVGTISFYDKKTGRFAALGHGITETRDNLILPISTGALVKTSITNIKKGEAKSPGDMRGTLYKEVVGQIRMNTVNGIYGDMEIDKYFESKEPIEVTKKIDIKEGKAKIYCTLLDNIVEEYEIEIVKVLYGSTGNKNMILKITDEKLLEQTGGIIQGMSGSPIVQNGKLVGAVTHVFLNDPVQGYGVFAENMIEDMNNIE